MFALHFGAVAVTLGSTVRRHKASFQRTLQLRQVRSIDATFLTSKSRGTSCDIIQFMSQGELIIETLTADAENESQNVWSFAFEVDRKSLGHRSTSPQSVFVGDRLKGQDPTLSSWFPNVGKDDCVFHLIENMKEPKNGAANPEEIILFKKLIHSATAIDANANEVYFLNNVRERVRDYVSSSIFQGNSSLNRFCDGIIMHMNGNIEREGIRSAQGSESFHFSNISERSIVALTRIEMRCDM